jgi:hypothetical protein
MSARISHFRPPTIVVASVLLLHGAALRAAEHNPTASAPETPTPAALTPVPAAPAQQPPAVELPTFQFGLWEYRRTTLRADTAKPQVATIKKCADPGADMREKMENLKQKGCQFAPLKRSGDHYVSSWTCQTASGAMRFRDVLTVKNANSYQDMSETHTTQRVSQQKLEATRLGDCPGMGVGAPLTPTPNPPGGHP